ncbi:CHAT domain-containing protein [Hypoxylon trugodes]|uniref:CHAT domain-containing protein n=1 Tax=Hypoxylon trugodes TaxID=326681 RepID=UPI0021906C64|nr:CHAT domain-containing protein [Hypoxylon trugodes]KAI1386848.1 CHAT domain-containing protein [Hypoxylon trugodes]
MSTDTHFIHLQNVVHSASSDDPAFPSFLDELATAFYKRFTLTGQYEDLDKSVQNWSQAAKLASENQDKLQNLQMITNAIDCTRIATENLSKDSNDAQRHSWLSELSNMYFSRYRLLKQLPDLDSSIAYLRPTLNLRDDISKPDLALRTERLGNHLLTRYVKAGNERDLDESIEIGLRIVKKTSRGDGPYKRRVDFALLRLLMRLRGHWTLQDARLSVPLAREMIILSQPKSAKMEYSLTLSGLLGEMAQHSHGSEGLDEAITIYEGILSSSSAELPNWKRAGLLSDLAACFALRHRNKRCEEDVNKGIDYMEEALELMNRKDKSGNRPRILNNYADLLRDKYEITRSIDILDKSVKNCQLSVDLSKPEDPKSMIYRHNLGQKLHERYEHTKHLADLNNSIEIAEDIHKSTLPKSLFRPQILNALGCRLKTRYGRLRQPEDLTQAARFQSLALEKLPPNHKEQAIYLLNMSTVLRSQYKQEGNLDYLHKAIDHARRALGHAAPDSWNYSTWKNHVGSTLETLYKAISSREGAAFDDAKAVLLEAIDCSREAVKESQSHSPRLAHYYLVLGRLFYRLYKVTRMPSHLEQSTNYYIQSYESPMGATLSRIGGAMGAALNLTAFGQTDWKRAAQYLDPALDLLSSVVVRSNVVEDHIDNLENVSKFPPIAASVAIKAGRSSHEALQILERSSGMIAALTINAEDTLRDIQRSDPELYERYEDLLKSTLSQNSLPEERYPLYSDIVWRRRETAKYLEEVENFVRQENRTTSNSEVMSKPDFLQLAAGDYLVTFNLSYAGSHAFLVSDDIRTIELPGFGLKFVKRVISLFPSSRRQRNGDEIIDDDIPEAPTRDDLVKNAMDDLWNLAVKPVLLALGIFSGPSERLPCVRWVGGGIASLLPLHAAGDNSPGSTDNAFCRVISSYAPTFKSLAFSRHKMNAVQELTKTSILTVGMPVTPGYDNINAREEVEAIEKHFGSKGSVMKLWTPRKTEILKHLKDCSMVHFACHGKVDLAAPRRSCLIVGQDGKEELTVADINAVEGLTAHIAYLSACSTAELDADSLLYEGIHLANSFNLAGFHHVIGTMMKADDKPAVLIASKFYELLLRHEDWRSCNIPQVLHDAVEEYRNADNNSTRIFSWCPFIHIGS